MSREELPKALATWYDYTKWVLDRVDGFPKNQMIERWLLQRDGASGLCRSPSGWNFVDAAFPRGLPPGSEPGGVSAVLNWIVVHALVAMEQLEKAAGEILLATRCRAQIDSLIQALIEQSWDASLGLFLDAPANGAISEHAQVLAFLSGQLPAAQHDCLVQWLTQDPESDEPGMLRCQAFFTHYLIQACGQSKAKRRIEVALEPWWKLSEQGFTTTPEHFGVTRSDCHAWSAHPILLLLVSKLEPREAVEI